MSLSGAARKSSFSWGFLFLTAPRRRALDAVYGFCRRVDDIVDSGELTPSEAQKALDFWKEEIARLYEGRPTHALARELVGPVREYRLPRQAFLDLIAGVEMDLRKSRYETFEELEPYLYGVAAAVGQLCVEIFGYRRSTPRQMQDYARDLGYAFQLTNILRDVGADLERGRVYLPLQDIRDSGYSLEALLRREHAPAFRVLMGRLHDRAKGYYGRARAAFHPEDRRSLAPAEVMARVYEGLLDQIRAEDYRVFFRRPRLPAWRKAALALSGWAHAHGLSL